MVAFKLVAGLITAALAATASGSPTIEPNPNDVPVSVVRYSTPLCEKEIGLRTEILANKCVSWPGPGFSSIVVHVRKDVLDNPNFDCEVLLFNTTNCNDGRNDEKYGYLGKITRKNGEAAKGPQCRTLKHKHDALHKSVKLSCPAVYSYQD